MDDNMSRHLLNIKEKYNNLFRVIKNDEDLEIKNNPKLALTLIRRIKPKIKIAFHKNLLGVKKEFLVVRDVYMYDRVEHKYHIMHFVLMGTNVLYVAANVKCHIKSLQDVNGRKMSYYEIVNSEMDEKNNRDCMVPISREDNNVFINQVAEIGDYVKNK